MATSLAAQLKRLAAPQTSSFQDVRKQASILFDAKEAASKDREVIYDIGVSGLEELKQMHGAFAQFEATLFDKNSIELQRSVQDKSVNAALNDSIRRFFFHLSPYFMLQPAHKCLEWLIRRFEIHKYNFEDFVLLILPYHETRVFVRCLQTMKLSEHDSLSFVASVGESGVPLSKRTIIEHCVRRPTYLKKISTFVYQAAQELGSKANVLQASYAFYCSIVLGVYDSLDTITVDYVAPVMKSISYGIASRSIDFTACAYMIIAHMATKADLAPRKLDLLIQRICTVPSMTTEATMVLVVIFQTQHEQLNTLSDDLINTIVRCKWLPQSLGALKDEGTDVIMIYRKVLGKCLSQICCLKQPQSSHTYSAFCEQLQLEIQLTDGEAEEIIECMLNSYVSAKKGNKVAQNGHSLDNITIEIDSEPEDFGNADQAVTKWYSGFLKTFERRYPTAFDNVVKRIMKAQGQYSDKKQNALRNVLDFLLQVSHNGESTELFENIFHVNAEIRANAVKYLVVNMRNIMAQDRGKRELLRDSILERLNDESCEVIRHLLDIAPQDLVDVVGAEELIIKLSNLVLKCVTDQQRWKPVTSQLITLLTDERIYGSVDVNRVIISLYPLNVPLGDRQAEKETNKQLFSTSFGKKYMSAQFYGKAENCRTILTTLEQAGQCTNPMQMCVNIQLLTDALPSPCSVELADKVLMYAITQLKTHHFIYAQTSDMQCLKNGKLPLHFITIPIKKIIQCVKFDPIVEMNFERQSVSLKLRLRMFTVLIERYCTTKKAHEEVRSLFENLLRQFLVELYPKVESRVEFLSHFYTVHLINQASKDESLQLLVNPMLQIRCQRLLNNILQQDVCVISTNTLVNVLQALTSRVSVVRECAVETIKLIAGFDSQNGLSRAFNKFLVKLLKHREELIMDDEQLSLVMFTIFCLEDSNKYQSAIEYFMQRTVDPGTPPYIVCGIMDFIKLLDNSHVLEQSASKAVTILDSVINGKDRVSFDMYESKVLQLVIDRFNLGITEQLVRSEVCKCLVTLTLQCNKPLVLPAQRKFCTPATMMIEAISGDIFETLPKAYAKQVVQGIVHSATMSDYPETNAVTAKLFKNHSIDAELVVDLLSAMYESGHPSSANGGNTPSRKAIIAVAPSERVLSSTAWKCGVTLLEHLQNKKNLENAHLLLPKLFECLKYCLDFEEQSVVEYVKQIVLSLLLHCIQKVEQANSKGESPFTKGSSVFKVEQIVQCIRGTQNPQTHHHALLLLAHVARYVPDQVLHNMMEIFTFVGSSIVRQDDAYSFQIISKIIESIVPTIAHGGNAGKTDNAIEQVIPILKIFSDIILDVPEHRRILLYVKLINTLGANEYLWVFLGVLIESDVMKGGHKAEQKNKPKSRAEAELSKSELSRRMEVALLIAREFEPTVIIQTCTNLIDYLRDLPMDANEKDNGIEHAMELDVGESTIFSVKSHDARQLKHFKYLLVQFVGGLVSSVFVINKIAQLNEEETLGMKKYYQNLIVGILTYVNDVSKKIDRLKAENSDDKIPYYWRAMLNNCYDILEGTISLLSADTLIIVVHGLLNHRFLMVRRKVIELLNNKLQYKQDYFIEKHYPGLVKLFDPIMGLVKNMYDEAPVVGTSFERMVIVQLCYIALRHLSKILTQYDTKKVQSILASLMDELHGYKKNPNTQTLASLILCIGELCSNLGPYSISYLPKFMPMLNKFLNAQLLSDEPFDMLTSSIVLLTVKIVDSLSRFLSPYLPTMLFGLTKLYAMIEKRNDPRLANMLLRLVLIWDNLSSTITLRVLLPAVEECYHGLIEARELEAIGPLMKLLSKAFEMMKSSSFAAIQGEVTELFLTALQFRCYNSSSDTFSLSAIDTAEAHVIQAFVVLILKLSESTFRPLFYKVFEWSIRETASNDRAITFFNVCCHVAEALKSLFVLFASDLVAIGVKLLNATNSAKVDGKEVKELHFPINSKNVMLLRYILKTLYSIVLYDNQNFINAVRFDMLLGPVTDQLENELIMQDTEIRSLVIDCLAQMAVAVMDDSLWRQLNYQVLMKTRNNEADVRLFALEACTEISRKLGESYAPLLPETIPFLAELMEDDNEDVEKAVHHSCREIGRATGEDLQSYF
ncbi:HEAT repeat-containing protein 1 homolog [Anopheles nili]|uniref:HEAT repeat-containing protein 1 homolog n=1 Tax=Anopheles nili TaxID=185578 RepID=UPI00237AD0A2|nr:HEAT repeat-containing protein 1 homolog [Anopheles nili]